MKSVVKFLSKCIEDILIISGLGVIVGTTFFINRIAGCYALGVVLFGAGVYFAINPLRR